MDDERRPMGRGERERMARPHLFAVNGDPELLEVLRLLFQDEGFNVTTTNYVSATFDQIAALDPDVLLVDLVWRDRAGWDLLERLRAEARTRGIPVVVLSTTPRYLELVRSDPGRFGGDALLSKPFTGDDLFAAVNAALDHAYWRAEPRAGHAC